MGDLFGKDIVGSLGIDWFYENSQSSRFWINQKDKSWRGKINFIGKKEKRVICLFVYMIMKCL